MVRIIRVFVSSPRDVAAERNVLEEVVQSINRTDGESGGFRLDLFRWEDNVVPKIGPSPQSVVDAQTPSYDIYIGIMSTRFGTPTESHGSGTEKEFEDALGRWKTTGSPWITFYFNDAPKSIRKADELRQYTKVCEFRDKLESQGIVASYIGVRGSKDAFYDKVSEHLRRILREVEKQSRSGTADITKSAPSSEESRPIVPEEYTRWLLSRCGEMELTGLEIKQGLNAKLEYVYTPLATSAHVPTFGTSRRLRHQATTTTRRKVGTSPQLLLDLLNETSLLVSGPPGSGKSTFCRWVTWVTCNGILTKADVPAPEKYQESFPNNLKGRLPILIRLRDFWQTLPKKYVRTLPIRELEMAFAKWIADQQFPGLDWPTVLAHLARGNAVLMLDGVDEVPPVLSSNEGTWYPREMLIEGLAEAVSRWTQAGNRVLISSRPYGLNSEQRRKLGLLDAGILSLDGELQGLLVRRWFLRLKEDRALGQETAEAMLNHICGETGLDELASNPLLLTAMCIIYDEGKRLPHDKYQLYDRIVDTVLHKRYLGQERIEVIRGRLAAIALGMHTGDGLNQRREAPEAVASDREVDLLLEAYQRLDGSTDEGLNNLVSVREDLLSQSGLLISQQDGEASFYHLSIQEFLAAERLFVLHGQKQEELVELFLHRGLIPGWRNTLAFLFGDLIDTFRAHAGVMCLRRLADRIVIPDPKLARRGDAAPVWNEMILFGDCLQVLRGRLAAIPDDLAKFFENGVLEGVNQEIAVIERQTLAVALGRLGDPRIVTDLRFDPNAAEHPGYVEIPAGKYIVGDERKEITIERAFYLSKYPVTNSQYALFIEEGGYSNRDCWSDEGWEWMQRESIQLPEYWRNQEFNAPNQPVVGVSWYEADAFCRWAGGMLPSEWDWEAAARGSDGFTFPWGNDWEDGICNSEEAKFRKSSVVGIFSRSQSSFGLEDMSGNVWEWCSNRPELEDSRCVLRGGSSPDPAGYCRAAFRVRFVPLSRDDDLGFRVAAVPSGEAINALQGG